MMRVGQYQKVREGFTIETHRVARREHQWPHAYTGSAFAELFGGVDRTGLW